MLSPAKHHLKVATDPAANLEQRRGVLALAKDNRSAQRAIRERCREDFLFWSRLFMWQYDPTQTGAWAVGPFTPTPRQEEVVLARPETHAHLAPYDRGVFWCIENKKTMACEKSRWQGATWLYLGVMAWHCGFHAHRDWLCVSRNKDAVDDGSKNALFSKLRYVLAHQPAWLMGPVDSTNSYLFFTRTKSEITGEATTSKAGVGGRASAMFVDEFPEIEFGDVIRDKTALTTHVRFFVGTHLGADTPFDRMCDPAQSPEVVKQQIHWTDGLPEQTAGLYEFDPARPTMPIILDTAYQFPPDYKFVLDGTPSGGPRPGVRSPWYDRKCREMTTPQAVAQNLDIDVTGSAKQVYEAIKMREPFAACRPPLWEGDLACDRRGEELTLAERAGGRLRLWVRPDGFGNLPPARYTAGADVSLGVGATNSCYTAIDGDRSLVVLEWADPWTDIKDFAAICVALCRWLKGDGTAGAYFAWDSAGAVGKKFTQEVMALGYGNIYYNEETEIRFGPAQGVSKNPGWYGMPKQRLSAHIDYRDALYTRKLADRSERCLKECMKYQYDAKTRDVTHPGEKRTNDPTGSGSNHGDLVVTRVIAWMLAKEMAVGGRRAKAGVTSGPEPYTQEWLEALVEMQRQRRDERW